MLPYNISIRPFCKTDAHRLAELANNENIARNLRDAFPHPYTLEAAEKHISFCQSLHPTLNFAIVYNDEYVGSIGLVMGEDIYRKSAEIGYFIGEDYWNKGIASKAVNLITRYAFETLGIIRIHTGVFEYNPASRKVLEKCGFICEGIFRKSFYKDNQLWDEYRYALLDASLV